MYKLRAFIFICGLAVNAAMGANDNDMEFDIRNNTGYPIRLVMCFNKDPLTMDYFSLEHGALEHGETAIFSLTQEKALEFAGIFSVGTHFIQEPLAAKINDVHLSTYFSQGLLSESKKSYVIERGPGSDFLRDGEGKRFLLIES